jgi:hypothetical protein
MHHVQRPGLQISKAASSPSQHWFYRDVHHHIGTMDYAEGQKLQNELYWIIPAFEASAGD